MMMAFADKMNPGCGCCGKYIYVPKTLSGTTQHRKYLVTSSGVAVEWAIAPTGLNGSDRIMMDVDGVNGRVYYADEADSARIKSVDLNGEDEQTILDSGDVSESTYYFKVYPSLDLIVGQRFPGSNYRYFTANLDGSGFADVPTYNAFDGSVAVDIETEYLYLWDASNTEIVRQKRDGSSQSTVWTATTGQEVQDMSIDYNHGKLWFAVATSSGELLIRKMDLDGANEETVIDRGTKHTVCIQYNNTDNRIYWADGSFFGGGPLAHASHDGSDVQITSLTGLTRFRLGEGYLAMDEYA